jgi:putative DNA primase/helicase
VKTTTVNAAEEFQRQMEAHGLGCSDPIIGDGKLHRYHVDGDTQGSKNAWYIFHDDQCPAGIFESWKTGERIAWSAKSDPQQSATEREAFRQRIEQAKQQADLERKRLADEAAIRARGIWDQSQPASDHPYLQKKQVQPHGTRIYEDCLVVPAYDRHGQVRTLQFIDLEGGKKFLRDGEKKGNCFTIGKPGDTGYLCEGFATGATIHEAMGGFVVVGFDAGNLQPVAERIRREYPDIKIIIAADNDVGTEGNPGLTKAKEAAAAVNGLVVYPTFKEVSGNGKPFSDFNDLFLLDGAEAVKMLCMSYKEGGVHETNFRPPTALEFVESIKEEAVDYILEGYLARGAVVLWVAKPKMGKSTIIYQAGRAIAAGRMFLGRETEKGAVLILAPEEHPRDIKLRLKDLGCENCTDIFIHCQPTDPTPDFFNQLTRFITENSVTLVIVDTLASFWELKDENDASAMTKAVKPLLQLARESGACVLMIHHSRKAEGAYGDEIRGSSALFGLVDVAVMMRNTEVENQRKLIARSRYPDTPAELVVELRDGEYVSLGDPDEAGRKARLEKMRSALPTIPEEAAAIIKRAGLKNRAGQRLLKWLTEHDEAERTGSGKKGSPYLYCVKNTIHAGSPSYMTRNEYPTERKAPDSFHAGDTGGCMNQKDVFSQNQEEEALDVDL